MLSTRALSVLALLGIWIILQILLARCGGVSMRLTTISAATLTIAVAILVWPSS